MKRFWFVVAVALMTSAFQSNAQTSIPFYGFELSNYEVGDTLEYNNHYFYSYLAVAYAYDTVVWVIIDKQVLSDSLVEFTARKVNKGNSFESANGTTLTYVWYTADTVSVQISNDSITPNSNNFLGVWTHNDSATITYDTLNGLKHLQLHWVTGPYDSLDISALENLGITQYHRGESYLYQIENHTLVYANVQHYGIYGEYQPLYSSTPRQINQDALVVAYNEKNKMLQLKPTVHLDGVITLYDVLGRSVFSSNMNEREFYVGHLTTGLYFYNLTGNQTASGKVLIR